jgi:hypothetical protein
VRLSEQPQLITKKAQVNSIEARLSAAQEFSCNFRIRPGKRMTSRSHNGIIAIAFTVVIATLLAAGLARYAMGRKPDRNQERAERMCSN